VALPVRAAKTRPAAPAMKGAARASDDFEEF
jgi:hypothetical protein